MNIPELAQQLQCPEDYLAYLKSILDGTEAYYSDEDGQDAEELAEQLLQVTWEEAA